MLFFWILWGDFCLVLLENTRPVIVPLLLRSHEASNFTIGLLCGSIPPLLNFIVNPVISTASDRTRTRWGRRIPYLMCGIPFVSMFLILLGFSDQIGKADEGESFIVVGRCAETVLGDRPNVISLFVLGDSEVKCKRVMEIYDLSERDAQFKMERHDKYRKQYHNYYCKDKWGDSRAYDLCINSSRLGFDETVNELEDYINRRRKMFK